MIVVLVQHHNTIATELLLCFKLAKSAPVRGEGGNGGHKGIPRNHREFPSGGCCIAIANASAFTAAMAEKKGRIVAAWRHSWNATACVAGGRFEMGSAAPNKGRGLTLLCAFCPMSAPPPPAAICSCFWFVGPGRWPRWIACLNLKDAPYIQITMYAAVCNFCGIQEGGGGNWARRNIAGWEELARSTVFSLFKSSKS